MIFFLIGNVMNVVNQQPLLWSIVSFVSIITSFHIIKENLVLSSETNVRIIGVLEKHLFCVFK